MPTTPAQWAIFIQQLQRVINSVRDAANSTGVNVIPSAYAVYDAPVLPALSINGASAALDATKTQFGNASLKLTATAATVTVTFTGDPITLSPNQRWIASVFIQSSRAAIAGTLALVTTDGNYPVNIGGNLIPGSWGRLYGDCDLTADFATSGTLTLTLTGCSVGDTFNLEGWQLEQASGATNLPSAFVNSAAPGSQDTLPDGSNYVRLDGSHASANVAYNYRGVWSSATAYVTGDETVYSGSYWLALSGSTNSAPAQGNAHWQVVGSYNNYQGAWSSTVTYYPGQETTYSGNYWVATATNTNSAPAVGNANWVIAGPQNLDKIPDGDTRVASPAIAGAGTNVVANPAFITAAAASENAGTPYSRWVVTLNSANAFTFVVNSNPADPLSIRIGSVTIPANTTYETIVSNNVSGGHTFSVAPGQQYWLGGSVETYWPYGLNPGLTIALYAAVAWYDRTGAFISSSPSSQINSAVSGVSNILGTAIAPANASYGVFQLVAACATGASAITTDTGAHYFNFGNVFCRSMSELTQAGSGQTIGDQRNLNPITWAGIRSTQSVSPLAVAYDTAAPANLSFTCASVTFKGGDFAVSYSASSASTTQTRGTGPVTYYFYYRDATNGGGSKALNFTTNQDDLSTYTDINYLGLITIAIPAGSSGGSGVQTGAGAGAGSLPAR
jgi:hypothetical protein